MSAITVVGGTLAGMAVAARLAKVRHEVTLVVTGDRLGPTDLPNVFTFPAPWRDLFTKSGRTLAAELARSGHELTSVPSRTIGDSVELPAERGGQFAALSAAYGTPVAERWRDLLDGLDDVWQARRPLGLEQEFDHELFRSARKQLRWGTTVEQLARRFDHPVLSEVIRQAAEGDPRRSPADEAMWLAVERTFGLWQVTTTAGEPAGSGVLVDALTERLRTRKVTVTGRAPEHADATVVAQGTLPRGWRGPRPWPKRAGSRVGERTYACGDHTHAGRTIAGQLLSAALAAYAVHFDLTGENIHPTNKDRRRAR
ncbi:MAG: NAD(P)/FAD-dependent oxidoreductase [Propionibacteriaceae bacterium]|nr:NAD(P)/FAD-dependent oxidoreductase [Propionibacteriaceae bacterium]